jgi:hypothetical protein
MSDKQKIENRIRSLNELEGVTVVVEGNTIRISHDKKHGVEWVLRWIEGDHYAGYFVNTDTPERLESKGVVSIHSALDSIDFVSAYVALDRIRARQKRT